MQRVIESVEGPNTGTAAKRVSKLIDARDRRREALGTSAAMERLRALIDKVAPSRARVLITGPSGTGKELVAHAVHRVSGRSGRFVKVNCAAIPDTLIESELFGHERGAFTGAAARRRGQFELAHSGTLFLDEVADMSLAAQAKVLRVLQAGELVRVGGERPTLVDVRVVAATNKDLVRLVRDGAFRQDLYFRLNVVHLAVPSLAERSADIPLLVQTFIRESSLENGFAIKAIDPEVLGRLRLHRWPGNVRELKNVVEHMVIMSGDTITVDDLPALEPSGGSLRNAPIELLGLPLRKYLLRAERDYIRCALEGARWNVSQVARDLDVDRAALHRKIKAHGLTRSETAGEGHR